jgi:predicted neuraminidase/glyoxylase-like metal-dependent hydrolase (beta-lactamase superfamily II)
VNVRRMARAGVVFAMAIAASHAGIEPAQARQAPDAPPPGLRYSLEAVAPGVYVAIASGVPYYVANSVVIVGESGVLLVDTGAGPAEARVLRDAIRAVTPLPVRYVVDTHFHFDHALGHAAFEHAVTIGHVETRAGLLQGLSQPTLASNLKGLPARGADLRAKARTETVPATRDALAADADAFDRYARELSALVPEPTQVTFTDQVTLWLGRREIRVLHLGRGHTAGDVVVYLPDARLVCTGDLFNGSIGFMGDAYVDEWAATLDRLAALDFTTVVPGHGKPFEGKAAIAPVQACLRDLWRQAATLKRDGIPAADAAARVDLRAHAARFTQFAKVGIAAFAVERIYAVIDERAAAVRHTEFLNERAPYPQCHASTIVEVSPGRLAAAWFGGTREGTADVGIWLTRFDGARWLAPVQVADGRQEDGTRVPTWNPVLFAPPGGPLMLFYKAGPSPSAWWGLVKTSTDGGLTWSAASRLQAPLLGPIKNKPVVLADGSWLSCSSTEGTPRGWRAHVELSRDRGRTWQLVGPIEQGPAGLEAIQGSVLVHRDGRLQALLRTRNGVLATTWSSDAGRTWSPLTASGLPNPNSGTDALTLKDGRHLLVYNHAAPLPATPATGPRYPLNVALSDDGVTWRQVLTLEDQPVPDGYAYPAVIQASDGLVHVTYTWNRERIRHVVIDPAGLGQ